MVQRCQHMISSYYSELSSQHIILEMMKLSLRGVRLG